MMYMFLNLLTRNGPHRPVNDCSFEDRKALYPIKVVQEIQELKAMSMPCSDRFFVSPAVSTFSRQQHDVSIVLQNIIFFKFASVLNKQESTLVVPLELDINFHYLVLYKT